MTKLQSRNYGLDLLRVLACYMVLQVHAGEFYYIADGGLVAAGGEPVWACWLNSLCRTAVPLFVMLSGFFLLPVRERTRDFFARRFVRVVVPFLVWCVLYAIYQFLTGRTDAAGALLGVCRIPVNSSRHGSQLQNTDFLWHSFQQSLCPHSRRRCIKKKCCFFQYF